MSQNEDYRTRVEILENYLDASMSCDSLKQMESEHFDSLKRLELKCKEDNLLMNEELVKSFKEQLLNEGFSNESIDTSFEKSEFTAKNIFNKLSSLETIVLHALDGTFRPRVEDIIINRNSNIDGDIKEYAIDNLKLMPEIKIEGMRGESIFGYLSSLQVIRDNITEYNERVKEHLDDNNDVKCFLRSCYKDTKTLNDVYTLLTNYKESNTIKRKLGLTGLGEVSEENLLRLNKMITGEIDFEYVVKNGWEKYKVRGDVNFTIPLGSRPLEIVNPDSSYSDTITDDMNLVVKDPNAKVRYSCAYEKPNISGYCPDDALDGKHQVRNGYRNMNITYDAGEPERVAKTLLLYTDNILSKID